MCLPKNFFPVFYIKSVNILFICSISVVCCLVLTLEQFIKNFISNFLMTDLRSGVKIFFQQDFLQNFLIECSRTLSENSHITSSYRGNVLLIFLLLPLFFLVLWYFLYLFLPSFLVRVSSWKQPTFCLFVPFREFIAFWRFILFV